MYMLHVVSGLSAASGLRVALDASAEHCRDRLVWFPDSLSVGPLEASDPASRLQWWQWWADMVIAQTGQPASRPGEGLAAFWGEVIGADHLVLWYGQGDAHDSAFFHAMCDRLSDNAFSVVTLDGASGAHTAEELARHLNDARSIPANERAAVRAAWKQLEQENQAFRILSNGNLVSAPEDYYDGALLNEASSQWTPIPRIVAPVMARMDIGDSPLFWRIKSLVESGVLVADDDPWLVEHSKVRLARGARWQANGEPGPPTACTHTQ
ncbi:Protein of uncharacterised function [Mycobacteroides abscessus subsp. abscessus]|nr:DUF3658 domain-containing protein [Mycobacteroides abscessus]MBE5494472.1 hypothetical protein [Mycobacteroides abscessus]MDM2176077.1 DUF3658 domain-containing protein [Mycobacteroides abscessus]MDM2207025.1 DUF3658 domain-containing protein [Mycobacteroides abscessus]MDM2230117.1 DUF3658 domain-containing protein [Mycobacteroides abscessus]MDM2243701.1 DUF3658 domain-containing protein [Mycobacteroides abscessus]